MRSGELARLADISTDALRHYERIGLLPKPARTQSGYRDYPAPALERVRLIQRALNAGFFSGRTHHHPVNAGPGRGSVPKS